MLVTQIVAVLGMLLVPSARAEPELKKCLDIYPGHCPGDDNIVCLPTVWKWGYCVVTERGKCPGGANYRYAVDWYKEEDGDRVGCSIW